MIKNIILKNYKSFRNIYANFCDSGGKAKKLILIYGENGSGKSNLMSAINFLKNTFYTLKTPKSPHHELENDMVDMTVLQDILEGKEYSHSVSLRSLVHDARMKGFEDKMELKIEFSHLGKDGCYEMHFEGDLIVYERLCYTISRRGGVYFEVSRNKKYLSPGIFHDLNYRKDMESLMEKFWGKHTLMAIIHNECNIYNRQYIMERVDSKLPKLNDRFVSFEIKGDFKYSNLHPVPVFKDILRNPVKGIIEQNHREALDFTEKFLNDVFPILYSDIKSVEYDRNFDRSKIKYQLSFNKIIGGRQTKIPASLESSGTKKILEILPYMVFSISGESSFIDEIDTGIHDILMVTLISSLEKSMDGQLIATTHNLHLMEKICSDFIYIISSDTHGYKKIQCVSDYKKRTQKNHNLRRRYVSGDYDGIPYPYGSIDFSRIYKGE